MSTIIPQHSPFTTTHEHLKFSDGSHVIVHSSPGRVQVTGYVAGSWIEYAGTARDAAEQARLLVVEAPDALWTMPREQSHRIALAMAGAVGAADYHDGKVSEAGSPEDLAGSERVTTRPVNLDGDGVAYIEHIESRVELVVKMRGRLQVALILSPGEAEQIGMALARPHGLTVKDLCQLGDTFGVAPSQMIAGGAL